MEGKKVVPNSSFTPRAIWLSSSIFVFRALRVVQPWVREIPPSVYFPSSSPEMEPHVKKAEVGGGLTSFRILVSFDGELNAIGSFGFYFKFGS